MAILTFVYLKFEKFIRSSRILRQILQKFPYKCPTRQDILFKNKFKKSKRKRKIPVVKNSYSCNTTKMYSVEDKLEAHPLISNAQLLSFDIRSKDVNWSDIIAPLEPRGKAVFLGKLFPYLDATREELEIEKMREVLVCHDMMGNYLEDRFYRSSMKYDDYRFFHWSGIDYFCYFSHNYITIPPCGWINAAHRHGVKVLGTFMTERYHHLGEILTTKAKIEATIAALVRLCKHFCFEGWLLNIECMIAKSAMQKLFYFVENLRIQIKNQVKNGVVFWYDSVTRTGNLKWQNEVNERNIQFFKLSDGMLVNYIWNQRNLEHTLSILEAQGEPESKSFFGIDVFGRGQVAKFKSNQTLAKIFKMSFSVGFFAPGWTFETLQNYGYDVMKPCGNDLVNDAFLLRNDKFWWSLWEYLPTHLYVKLPLYTDFCVGSGKHLFELGEKKVNSQFFSLLKQSLQPSVPLYNCVHRNFNDAFSGGSSLEITQSNKSFRIFATDYHIDGSLIFAYAFKLDRANGELDYILRIQACDGQDAILAFLGEYDVIKVTSGHCYLPALSEKYAGLLTSVLEEGGVDIKIPPNISGNWKVRYYLVNCNAAIQIKDVGALYRKQAEAKDVAYLGAVYLNNVKKITLPEESNAADLKIEGGKLVM